MPFPTHLEVPAGGDDRVHRMEVGPRGLTRGERAVGPVTPVRLMTSSVPHPGYPHKVAARDAFQRAAELARVAGADDALLLSPEGFVAEATIWCLFWWEPEGVAAPSLDLRILPGVSRSRIEELAGPVRGCRVVPRTLAGRALWLANAARGIVEVQSLDGVRVPPDPRTAALAGRFWT